MKIQLTKKVVTAITLGGLMLFAAPASTAQAAAALPQPTMQSEALAPTTITITGEATQNLAPDYAILEIGMLSKGRTALEAKQMNDKAISAALLKLQALGIAKKDMTTSQLSLSPIYDYRSDANPNEITGYEMTNTLTIKVSNLSHIPNVIDTITASGLNTLNSLSFHSTQADTWSDSLTQKAIENAKNKADLMARTLGLHVSGVKEMSLYNSPARPTFRAMNMSVKGSSTPIESGEITVTKSVNIVFYATK